MEENHGGKWRKIMGQSSLNVSCVASCQKAFSMFSYMLSYNVVCP